MIKKYYLTAVSVLVLPVLLSSQAHAAMNQECVDAAKQELADCFQSVLDDSLPSAGLDCLAGAAGGAIGGGGLPGAIAGCGLGAIFSGVTSLLDAIDCYDTYQDALEDCARE